MTDHGEHCHIDHLLAGLDQRFDQMIQDGRTDKQRYAAARARLTKARRKASSKLFMPLFFGIFEDTEELEKDLNLVNRAISELDQGRPYLANQLLQFLP